MTTAYAPPTDPAVPAPVIPATDPATGNTDAVLAEAQARQITSASLSSYGSLPNPQLAFEAITTGATPTIASMILAGNPLFQSELAGAPAGQSALASPYPQVPSKINDPSQSLWQFDPKADAAGMKDKLSQDQNSSWRSFGMTPEMNFGWMQAVENGPSAQTKKWQQLLLDKGFFQGQNYQPSGVFDKATTTAFQGFLTQWATPYALFSTDATTKSNATMFVNALGIDVSTLETSIGRDPTTLAQIAQGWMAAQGPDQSPDQKSALQHYADTFGLASLPDTYQSILRTDPAQSVRNLLASVTGIVGGVPLLGGALHAATNIVTGNLDPAHITEDPRQTQADAIKAQMKVEDAASAKIQGLSPTDAAKLTATDLANMDPALQAVQDDAGFLGFMNSYDNARTTGILTIWDTLGEAFTKGKLENPFDPMSTPRIEAAAAHNDLAAGIFGAGWASDNPVWASMFNIVTNIADDPTSYVSLIGKIEAVQRMNGVRTVSRVIGKPAALDAFAAKTAEGMRVGVNQGLFNAARTAYAGNTLRGKLTDVGRMYGITGAGGARDVESMKLLDKAMKEKDPHKAWDLIQNGDPNDPMSMGFGWKVQTGKGVYNARANWQALSQVKSQALLGKMRVAGGFNVSTRWNALTDPAGTSQFLGNMSHLADMKPEEITPLLDAYTDAALHDPNNAVKAANAVTDAIMKAYKQSTGVTDAMITKHLGDSLDHIVTYAPDASGAEQSMYLSAAATNGKTPEQVANLQAVLNQHMTDLKALQGTGASAEMIKAQQDEIARIARPGPALTTQLGNEFQFPMSPFDMVVLKNPAFRNSVELQKKSGLDQVMNAWRRITIARVSSAMRMDIGDDMIRPFTELFFSGHQLAASNYLSGAIMRMAGLLLPGSRKKIVGGLDQVLKENPEVVRLMQGKEKIVQEGTTDAYRTAAPGDVGYTQALGNQIRNHWLKDPVAQAWLKGYSETDAKAAGAAAHAFVKKSDDPVVQAWLQGQNGHLNAALFDQTMQRFDEMMGGYMENPAIRKMATTGVNQKDLARLVRDQANTPQRLPLVPERQSNPFTQANFMNLVNKMPDAVFEHVTGPMINTARSQGFLYMKSNFENTIRDYFKDQPRYGTKAFEQAVDQESTAQAIDWITNNTYQGTRSVAGATMRNIMPFYGATTNMDRFYMRQTMAHPFVGSIVAHAATASQQAQNPYNQNSPGLTGLQGALAHLGFGAGEGVQFNPLHAFFLTSDGIGSMIPGTGPIFAPLWNAASQNPALAQFLVDTVPGAQSQIDYNTGKARPQFAWLADMLSGASLALTGQNLPGEVPVIGGQIGVSTDTTNAQVDAKVAEWERNKQGSGPNGQVTPADKDAITREVGRDLALQGAASYTLPVDPYVTDTQHLQSAQNLDQWRQQTSDVGKDQVILQNLPGVTEQQWQAALANTPNAPTIADLIAKHPDSDAALMAFEDHRVSASNRDAIANASPWVVSASQSKYQSANLGAGVPDRPFDLPQWQVMRNNGDITLIAPDQYLGAISNERDINTGWLEYDNIKNQEYAAMVQNGWTTTDPRYQAWNQAVFEPQVIAIQNAHPAWWQQFGAGGSGTTAADLAGKTRALRTLQTWEVLPQHSDFESQQSVFWRNALQLRDNAAGQLYALKAGGGSTAEQQLVMQSLSQQLQGLASQNPTFAAMLGGFRFSNWEDVVTLMSDEMTANALAGYPASVGPQGTS